MKIQVNILESIKKLGYSICTSPTSSLIIRKHNKVGIILRTIPASILIGFAAYGVDWSEDVLWFSIQIAVLFAIPFIFIIAIIDVFIWRLEITKTGLKKVGVSVNEKMIENFEIHADSINDLYIETRKNYHSESTHYIFANTLSKQRELMKIQDKKNYLNNNQLNELKNELWISLGKET